MTQKPVWIAALCSGFAVAACGLDAAKYAEGAGTGGAAGGGEATSSTGSSTSSAGSTGTGVAPVCVTDGPSTACPSGLCKELLCAACAVDAECGAGHWCDLATNGGTCKVGGGLGTTCTAPGDCGRGNCADDVCCDTACAGTCSACSAAKKGVGSDGTCGFIQAGTDPDSECAATCASNTLTAATTCNGSGACSAAVSSVDCRGYACDAMKASCPTTCAAPADCAGGASCTTTGCAFTWAGWAMPNPVSAALPNPASYDTITVAGVVIDKVTGLWWQQPLDTNPKMGASCAGGCTPAEAIAYCKQISLAGYADWRLPTRIELTSLVDYTKASPEPTIDTVAFPNTPSNLFWTSTPLAGIPSQAWVVDFVNGNTTTSPVSISSRLVRCVR